MKHYEVQLFSTDNPVDAIEVHECDSIIKALNRFTYVCKTAGDVYDLDDYYVWVYDRMVNRYIMYYNFYKGKEEFATCQY